jgi:hypothetical protein
VVVCHHAAAAEAAAEACHHDGCPGCAMDRRKVSLRGSIPYKELFYVGATSLAACKFICIHLLICPSERTESTVNYVCRNKTTTIIKTGLKSHCKLLYFLLIILLETKEKFPLSSRESIPRGCVPYPGTGQHLTHVGCKSSLCVLQYMYLFF